MLMLIFFMLNILYSCSFFYALRETIIPNDLNYFYIITYFNTANYLNLMNN